MAVAPVVLVSVVSLSLTIVLLLREVQWDVLIGSTGSFIRELHGISQPCLRRVVILKPLKGVDPGLSENLSSFFEQDYSNYVIALGCEDPEDPAMEVAKKVSEGHPDVPCVVMGCARGVGKNPKVRNLWNLAARANPLEDDVLLISDSNVRVEKTYLSRLMADYRAMGGHGLLWSLFRGVGEGGLGGTLEALDLNTFCMSGIVAVSRLFHKPCALGKSMLILRKDFSRAGGCEHLAKYLAEDQVLAEEVDALDLPVVMSEHCVDNVLGRRSVRDFSGRFLRWARIRRNMNLPAYLLEPLLNPVFLAFSGAFFCRTPLAFGLFGASVLLMAVLDFISERLAGIRRNFLLYPILELVLGILKGFLWFVPLVSRSVVWRGNRVKIGPRTLIRAEGV